MVFLVIGVLVLILVTLVIKKNPVLSRFSSAGRILGFLFIALGILSACIIQINPGEIGVKILFDHYRG